ncbi:MAG: site-2 protease family protein [Candidatus Aminicenantes bacterium]|nr:site-2 protease family protein [Candidatus Aminicenantes bacterium]
MEIITKILAYFVLLFAITIHEASHGWAAKKFGDLTAFHMGRVTINPIPHIDPIGTVLLPLLMMFTGIPLIGWAKPVPVNPMNLRNPRRDNLWISIAGPLSNFSAAMGFFIVIRIMKFASPKAFQAAFYTVAGQAGQPQLAQGIGLILYYGILINTFLGIFNLIPIPPLDGSGVLMGFLSNEAVEKYERIRPYGFLIIIGLLYLGVFRVVLGPVQSIILTLITI